MRLKVTHCNFNYHSTPLLSSGRALLSIVCNFLPVGIGNLNSSASQLRLLLSATTGFCIFLYTCVQLIYDCVERCFSLIQACLFVMD